MKKFFSSANTDQNYSSPNKIGVAIKSFSITERFLFSVFIIILIFSTFGLLYNLNEKFLVTIPEQGGELNEGSIGAPRLINPILAVSETDRDLTALVYSGLMRATTDGKLITDLADRYEVSEDKLEYTFYLKDDITFHDGNPVTSDDVIFTIISAQNPELKSPKRSNWEGISIEKVSDKILIFRLKQTYAPFLQNMTLGILPKHIWEEVDVNEFNLTSFNSEPIGSGPYKVSKIKKDRIGIPESYSLEAFKNFALGEPFIKKINFKFVKNQEELMDLYTEGEVDSIHSINPSLAKELQENGARVETFPLPRVFGVFFNQDEATVLSSSSVRRALNAAAPKDLIVDEVLAGFGSPLDGPIPHDLFQIEKGEDEEDEILDGEEILVNAGWERNEEGVMILDDDGDKKMLSFSIATANVPELVAAAEKVQEAWEELGAKVNLEKFESTDLNSNVIRPRKYDALLFGMVVGRDLDFYAFWHSSQRNDPGLNISKYANIEVDEILEDLREVEDEEVIKENLTAFTEEINKDVPAVFLYTPEFIYVLPFGVQGVEIKNITTSEERFLNIHKWYIETNRVWTIFE